MAPAPPRTLHTTNGFSLANNQLSRHPKSRNVPVLARQKECLRHPKLRNLRRLTVTKTTRTRFRGILQLEKAVLGLNSYDRLSDAIFLRPRGGKRLTYTFSFRTMDRPNFIRLFVVRSSTSCAEFFAHLSIFSSTMTSMDRRLSLLAVVRHR